MGIILALALVSIADLQSTIDRVCMPYTAHGGTAEVGDQAARAESYSLYREPNDTRIFRKGEIMLSLGTLFGERFCQIDISSNFVAELNGPAAAAALQRNLSSDRVSRPTFDGQARQL
ncbi:MAG: hypothetical protein EOO81_10700, partial [Oxalobacteraceae bacterium]